MPVIDFSHLHARSIGKINSYNEFKDILILIEKKLGKNALQEMHIHVSGINYGEKGEKHLYGTYAGVYRALERPA